MAGDNPPFLPVGTEVSAKYRGAFCEAKVKKIVRSVKCKIYLKETLTSVVVTDDTITKGSLKVGSTVEYKNPDTGQCMEAVINKLTDCSMYTVVFDDGDEKTLRRTQCCLKGEKHFIESETLDNLPLSHPEHFGTPVMSSKTKRRSGRPIFGNEEEDSEEESTDESLPRRAVYKGKNQELVGKVFLAEIGEKKKQVLPVLVVLPDAHATELKTKDHLLVKSFKDGKFHTYQRKELKDFSKDAIAKIEDKNAKQALERAVTFSEKQELPSNWEREELLGTDEEDFSDEEEGSDDEPIEEKDRFVAQLYKFMDDRGTSINRMPTLGSKDLNLYRLFNIVQTLGGYNKVTNSNKWKAVAGRMKTGLPSQNMVSHQLKTAYKKYLHAFEDFYRKLGSTMGTISRPGRSRNNSGRGMGVYKSQVKEQEKTIATEKEESKSDGESDMDDGDSRSTRSPLKRERVTRRDLDSVVRENRERRDGSKDSRRSDTFKQEEDSKKSVIIKEDAKKTKSAKKQEEKKESDDEEAEAGKQEEKKKTIRRRSARKEEIKKEEEEETEEKKTDPKTKSKVAANKEPEIKPGTKKQDDVKSDRKDDKKVETKKEKAKVTKKDIKKEVVEEESKEVPPEKMDKKTKKEVTKKSKNEEESTPGKKKNREEGEEEMEILEESKPLAANEYPLGTKLQVRYGKGRTEKVYDAKIIEIQRSNNGLQYLVHYAGWNMRYDEWIRPEQVVNVLNKPSDIAALKKKAKESPPKSPKGPVSKKGKSPASAPSPSPSPVPAVQRESRPVKRSPAHTPNTPQPKQSKQRPTRSNSIEQRGLDSLPGKSRRTRRSSGLTESSDLISHGSISDDNNEFEGDLESDGTESVEMKSGTDKDEMSEKSEDFKLDKEEDDRSLMECGKLLDKKTDILPVEQDLLNKAAEIEKVNEVVEGKVNKTSDSKTEIKEKEEKSDKIEDQTVKSPPKLDSIGKSQELFLAKDIEMPNIQAIDDVMANSPLGTKEKKEEGKEKMSDSKESSEDLHLGKTAKSGDEGSDLAGDESELKEGEVENVSDVTAEKDVREKGKPLESKDKPENEGEKKQRGRKKDQNKVTVMEKKEPGKEKRRGRPSLASIAEKKAASQTPGKPQEESEPAPKKTKEKAVDESMDLQPVPAIKQEEIIFESVTKNDEEIPKEENEFEKKRVKKKMKRKAEASSDTEVEKKEKKEPAKGPGKSSKAEKTAKSKGKKVKEEEEVDSVSVIEWEDNNQGDGDMVPSDCTKPQPVIPSEFALAGAEHSESATCSKEIKKDNGANFAESNLEESKSEESMDSKSSTSRLPNSSALYENTPPTTPEHEMDATQSQEHTHDLVKGDCNNSSDQQYVSESPSGNASPSSNDGSVGSGNVACSESSNNEAPVHTSLGKRRRESEDVTPSKRKRRGKQKQDRKLSKQIGSDSDEGPERNYSPEPGSSPPSKISTPARPQSQRAPRYQLNLDEGKYLEGEKRISFLMEKIQEIRKIYMNLKSEVACIDRRRKRAKRRDRDRDSAQNSSSGTPEGETAR